MAHPSMDRCKDGGSLGGEIIEVHPMRGSGTVLLAATVSFSMPAGADSVDDYINSTLAQKKIPGASVLVVNEDTILKEQGYGFANVELRVPATADTIYQSGSIGKQFTAAGILLLVEDGKLALDDRLSKYFPDAPATWHRITVRHLLTHTSGIRDDSGSPDIDLRRDYSDDELLKLMMRLPIDFEPGTQWSYSNSGYVILGLLTSKVTGMHWSDFQTQRLFKPLGMTTTRVISESDIISNRAAGYELDDKGQLKNQQWVSPTLNRTADGSLYFTIKDLAAWDKALRDGRFLSASSRDTWVRPVHLANGSDYPYGFGWFIHEQRGRRLIGHTGAWQGFRVAIERYPDEGLTVVVLTNLAAAEPGTMAHEIAGLVEPSLKLPEMSSSQADPVRGRSAYLHQLLESWANSRRDPRMAKGLAETATGSVEEAEWRADTGAQLQQQTAFRYLDEDDLGFRPIDRRGQRITSIAYYALETKEKRYAYRFYLDREGQVADFYVEAR